MMFNESWDRAPGGSVLKDGGLTFWP